MKFLKRIITFISFIFVSLLVVNCFKFVNKSSVVTAEELETFLNIDYRINSFPSTEKYSYYHVAGSNSTHGVVPFLKWANESEAGQGYIIYRVNIPSGYVVDTLSLSFDAIINDSASYDSRLPGNVSINVYLSQNVTTFTSPVESCGPTGSSVNTFTKTLDDYAKNYRTFYLKMELNHPSGTFVLAKTGVKLFSILLTGTIVEKSTSTNCSSSKITYYDFDFTIDDNISSLTIINMGVKDAEGWRGLTLINDATESCGSVIFDIEPYLENQLESLNLIISSSRFAYYFGDNGNYISFLASYDGINYSLLQKYTGSATSIDSFDIDFSMFFNNQIVSSFYIKIECGTLVNGRGFNGSWICLQNIQIKGKEASHNLVDNGDEYVCTECGKTFTKTISDPIEQFINNYLHMDKNVSGQCETYYSLAKSAYLDLSVEQRRLFLSDDKYAQARNRFIAWANYYNETITVDAIYSNNYSLLKQNSVLVYCCILMVFVTLSSFFVVIRIKRKKTY